MQAYCQQLEDEIEDMKERMSEMQSELNATKSQLAQARVQQEALVQSLQEERASNTLKKDASDSGTFKSLSNSEETGDDCPWNENLNIAAHSKSIKKVKPFARRQIFTSTPEKSNELTTYPADDNLAALKKDIEDDKEQDINDIFDDIDKTFSNFVSNEKETEQVNEPPNLPRLEEFESANSGTDDELTEINGASSGNDKLQQSSKRDSGIVSDNGLSPITT